jgi:low temperature requirement protein LtrA
MTLGADKKTGYLELFFDLVFVFAVTQLVTVLHDDHGLTGWRNTVLLAWLVWWAWSQFAWAGNAIDLDRRITRVGVLGITGVTLVVAAAIPESTGPDGGLRFALPYAAVRLSGLALYWAGLRHDPEHRAALRSYLPIAAVSPLVVLIGGALDTDARPWVWLVAVAVDIASAIAGGRGEFRVAPRHFAERHALIVIIALGESIVGIGATVAESPLTAKVVAVVTGAFVILGVQWWGYFDWVQAAAEHRLASEGDLRRRGRLARDLFTFGHFPIVLGSVIVAYGLEEAVAHPSDHLEAAARWSIGAGLALFYAGFLAGNARAVGGVLVERALALVAVAVVTTALGPSVSAVALLTILAATLVVLATLETRRSRASAP